MRLLLDGQQRITSLYGIVRGEPPAFFDGDPRARSLASTSTLANEEFRFYQRLRMQDDPLWVDVSKLMRDGPGRGAGAVHRPAEDSYRNTPRRRATSSAG